MSKVMVNEENLSNIADSIRAKNGTQDTYKPNEMSDAIDNLPTSQGDDYLPSDLPDIEQILIDDNCNGGEYENACICVTNSIIDDTSYFNTNYAGVEAYKTSDGELITSVTSHTWDRTKDINGKYRWVIEYSNDTAGREILRAPISPIYAVVKDVKYTRFYQNNSLKKIKFINSYRTATTGAFLQNNYNLVEIIGYQQENPLTSISNFTNGAYQFKSVLDLDASAVTSMSSAPYIGEVQDLGIVDLSGVTGTLNQLFAGTPRIRSVQKLDVSKVTALGTANFNNCRSLEHIYEFDVAGLTSDITTQTINTNNTQYVKTMNFKNVGVNCNLSYLYGLTIDSAEYIINNAKDMNGTGGITITFYSQLYNKLSADILAVAQSKNITIASA